MVVNKSLRKELFREIRNSRNRFLSIFVMVALGVMFLVGLRSAAPDMRATSDHYFDAAGFYDVQVLSTLGLTEADIRAFSQVEGVEKAEGGWSVDAVMTQGDAQKVVKAISLSTDGFDEPTLLEGRMPETAEECLLDAKIQSVLNLPLGSTLTLEPGEDMEDALTSSTFTVVGIAESPLYIALDRGTSTLGDGSVSGFLLLPEASFALDYYTVAYISAEDAREKDAYGAEYQAQMDALVERLENAAEERADLRYQTLYSDAQREIDDAQAELDDARAQAETEIADGQSELDDARQKLDDGWAELNQAKTDYAQYTAAVAQLEESDYAQGEVDYETGLAAAAQEIVDAEQELKDGEADYASGLQELEDARINAEAELSDAQAEIDEAREKLAELQPADVYVLDRNSNYGFVSYDQNATRMENLARMFPLIFFVVAALVCLTTMTRMVEEERTQIGSIKAMGYGTGAIAGKFLIYGAMAALGGAAVGAVIGTTLIPWVIFSSYGIMYTLPELQLQIHWGLCLGAAAAGLVCTMGATLWAMFSTARSSPAELMRPKAPKAGKRIFLERIPFLWKHFSFSVKVSARNLLRYKKRFWMTVIGVAGCTALLIAGLGLRSSIFNIIDIQFGGIYRYDAQVSLDTGVEGVQERVTELLEADEDVEQVAPVNTRSVTFQAGGASVDGYLTVTDDPSALNSQIDLREMESKEHLDIPDDGVIIDEKLSEMLEVEIGDEITIDCGQRITAVVRGINEHYVYHYAYMTEGLYETLTGEDYQVNEYLITTRDTSDETISRLSQKLMALKGVRSVSNLPANARSFRETLEVVNAAVTIIVLSAAALALVVLYNLTNINITERIRELATIKVLGFYDMEVAMYVYRENIVLTVLGIALGQVLGKFLCTYLVRTIEMDIVMFGREALPQNYAVSVVLSLTFAVIVNILMFFRMKKIDMVQSLKSVE